MAKWHPRKSQRPTRAKWYTDRPRSGSDVTRWVEMRFNDLTTALGFRASCLKQGHECTEIVETPINSFRSEFTCQYYSLLH